MKNYSNYKPEDFLTDERFRKWMLSGGREESLFWENFKEQYPEKITHLTLARNLFMSLHQLQVSADKTIKDKVWAQVQDSMNESSLDAETNRSLWVLYRWWMAAATFLLVSGLAWYIQSRFNHLPLEYEKQVSRAEISLSEKVNTAKTQQTVLLKDGTKVKLKPGSKLSYSDFSANQRVVYLKGEGYFDVAKDSAKPFLVYAGHIVVRVVGTSFHVVSNPEKATSNVSVTSGKVMVYATDKLGNYKEARAIYLSPNQKVVFDANTKVFEKGLVAQPLQLTEIGSTKEFYYTNTSINSILDDLETAYGVTIRRNNTLFESCKVTAPLGDLPLFRKLDIICQTIGATYEVFGTEIVISGGACNL